MNEKIDKIMNDAFTDMKKKDLIEKREDKKILKEAEQGKRDFILIKRGENISIYPKGNSTYNYVVRENIDELIKKGYAKILSKDRLEKYLQLVKAKNNAYKKYIKFLHQEFEK